MDQVRILPTLTEDNRFFWTGGRDGILRILRCSDCEHWIHPPSPVCPICLASSRPTSVSGAATVHSFTVNYHPWFPGMQVPYVVAIVELPEQSGLRLTTNIVNCQPDQVRIGMAVAVTFCEQEDVFLPLFEPVTHG